MFKDNTLLFVCLMLIIVTSALGGHFITGGDYGRYGTPEMVSGTGVLDAVGDMIDFFTSAISFNLSDYGAPDWISVFIIVPLLTMLFVVIANFVRGKQGA